MTSSSQPVVVMIPGDLHLTDRTQPNYATAVWAVAQANGFICPDFVQFIGDNVQDGTDEQYALFRELIRPLRSPWNALVGDHDAQGDASARLFRKHVHEPYGSTVVAGHRFIRLNTQEARPVGLSPEQLSWFRLELGTAAAARQHVVIFQHNYPYQIWEEYAGPGIDAWRELVQTRRIQAIITGHTHYWQEANDGRNVAVTTRSIGDPEGGPAGYMLAAFSGQDFAATYRSPLDSGPLVLITHPCDALLAAGPAHVISGRDEVRAMAWSNAPVEEVAYRIDGSGDWAEMQCGSDSVWFAPLQTDSLTKGTHRLVVRANAATASEHAIEFVFDPTGRYTPVPMVRPLVSSTNFC